MPWAELLAGPPGTYMYRSCAGIRSRCSFVLPITGPQPEQARERLIILYLHPAMHACCLPQVLPTSLTQLRLSYATNELGEAPAPVPWEPWDEVESADEDSDADEGGAAGVVLMEQCPWHDWVTPLENGLARLTGAVAA